jgi:hypothetical protein
MSAKSSPVVVSVNEWTPTQVKFMQPKINERGGKSINIISGQTNRSLHISTPLLMTWGISDFLDEKTGESDGKYSMTLNFPNEEYATSQSREFLQKLKDFENTILDAAVKNSEVWWGEEMSREVAKHTFFPFIKYSKSKETKKVDLSKPPSIRAKVPYYDGRWAVEIYDPQMKTLFPCENPNITPIDLVPKLSSVACVLQCGGIWIGGKGWGLTWKLVQCIVKPKQVVSVYGKCHIQLSKEELATITTQHISEEDEEVSEQVVAKVPVPVPATAPVPISTEVDDSDDEREPIQLVPVVVPQELVSSPPPPTPSPSPVEEPAPAAAAVKKVVKKVVKK